MKQIGLIGGVSWVSTVEYYRRLNRLINNGRRRHYSAKIVLYSFDFEEILIYQKNNDEENELRLLAEKVKMLEEAGADIILICSNTTSKMTDELNKICNGKIINIVDAMVLYLRDNYVKRVGLLGTKYTMELDFYKNKLRSAGIDVVIPNEIERLLINHIIYNELCHEVFTPESKQAIITIIKRITDHEHPDGIILGCTELPLLVNQDDVSIHLYDSIDIHINAALTRIGLPVDSLTLA